MINQTNKLHKSHQTDSIQQKNRKKFKNNHLQATLGILYKKERKKSFRKYEQEQLFN
jgi:hypothetical protein